MSRLPIGIFVVSVLAACVTACVAGDPADTNQSTQQLAQDQPQSDPSSAVDETPDVDPDALWSATPANSCRLESLEACQPGQPICVARCCDGVLLEDVQPCDNCLNWARNNCSKSHGGAKVIRWQAHW